ncbi:MAG: hypothetical protein CME06_02400 [Gemmatimonadetes bacterium]|nr:hypothetical protein [Gemmatimonadota bacterium]
MTPSRGSRLSIIVPVSRGPEFIETLIRSLERQSLPGLCELVLVTDGPASYDSDRIALETVVSPSPHPSSKRNVGVGQAANTEYLAFIDDDVRLEPDWVEQVLRALDAGADVVTGPTDLPYSDGFRQKAANGIVCSPLFSLKKTLANPAREQVPFYEVSLCNVAMKRRVWEDVGGFNEVAYYWVDDAEFFFIARRHGFELWNDPTVRAAHYKRPLLWPLMHQYFRQRWYAGLSTWQFPELYLPQAGVVAAAILLVALVVVFLVGLIGSEQMRLMLVATPAGVTLAGLATVVIWGGRSVSPSKRVGRVFISGASLALCVGATLLGFWGGLIWGPFYRLWEPTARGYRRFRYRDRASEFEGKEIVQPSRSVLRQTMPMRLWTGRFPQWLIYFVTARCNARCPMCFYLDEIEDAKSSKELAPEEVRRIVASIPPITYFSLSGGEPFLRDDLSDLVQAFINGPNPIYVSIPTNGSFPDRVERAFEVLSRRNYLTNFDLHLSLDGPPEVHDRIRGSQATYAHVMETHRAVLPLARRRDNVSIKFVVTCSTENIDHLEDFLEHLVRDVECDRVSLNPLHGNFRDKEMAVDPARYLALVRRVYGLTDKRGYRGPRYRLFNAIKRVMDGRLETIHQQGDFGRICGAGKKIAVIGPQGDVLPCEPLQESVGGLRDHDYDPRRVLAGEAMGAFAEKHLGTGKCHCNWGCAIGNALVHDPWFYPAVGRELLRGVFEARDGRSGR